MRVKILMVCLGNICRSPLAEGILQAKLDSNKYFVASAGTSSHHKGEQPDPRSIRIAEKYNIDISQQSSDHFSINHFDAFDFIYAMDQSNYKNIIKLARNISDKQKVKLILDELNLDKNLEVPDPYYGGDQGFENVFKMLNQACENIALKLQ